MAADSKHPPQRTLLSLAIVTVVLVVGYIVYDMKPWSVLSAKPQVIVSVQDGLQPKEVDSDGDGLPDWKELLYGSDKTIPDTDKDGTNDGDEVIVGRDPTRAGPGDAIRLLGDVGTTTGAIDGARRAFLEKFLRERSFEIQEDTFRQIIKRFDPKPLQPRYSLANLVIVSDTATSSMHEFGNTFGRLINMYTSNGTPSEDDIIRRMMEVKDKPEVATYVLRDLELPAINYRNFAADLSKIPVPISLAKYHLSIVNGYDVMSLSLLEMRKLYTDPVQGAGAYQAYQIEKMNVTVGYAGIVHEFSKRGIFFDANEPGAPFTWTPRALEEERQGQSGTK